MMQLLDDDFRRDPYPLYAALRQAAPVQQVPGAPMWMVLDHASVKRALSDHEAFSSEVTPPTGKAPDWLIFSDPPRHSALRGIILKAFTPKSIALLEPRVRALSQSLLTPHLEAGEFDLVADYANLLPTLVIAELLGIPSEDRARFVRWGEVIMTLSYAIAGGEAAAQAMAENGRVKEEMRAYLAALLPERRRAPTDDLLGRLVRAEVDGQHLTDDEVLGFFQLLLAASTETTTGAISNAILCFVEHPGALQQVRDRPELLPQAIEEVLRYRSPGQIMFRQARRDVVLHGTTIPAGGLVLVMIGAANRDPALFTEPDRFDLTRDPKLHIAFGHGLHYCLGAALARLEARVALSELLGAWSSFSLASEAPWTPRRGLTVHGPERLRVRFARAR